MSKEARTRATRKYVEKTYDRIGILVPKGFRKELKEYAESKGMSVNHYITSLIKKDMGIDD